MKKDKVDQFYYQLLQSLNLLAAPFETQIKAFPSFIHLPDEIALTFNNSYLLSDQILESGLISKIVYSKLREIDFSFDKLSTPENTNFWTLEAMQSDNRWQHFREMATHVLELLNQNPGNPELNNLTFIPS